MPKASFALTRNREIFAGQVFRLHEETWRAPDGSSFLRQNIIHPGAVAVLAFSSAKKVLMLRQFRTAARGWLLEIPAGTLERGESPLACAKRELIEETNCSAKKWDKLGAIYTAPGFCTEVIHLYRAWELEPAKGEKDEDEHIEVAEMTVPEVKAAVKKGLIRDGKTLSALHLSGKFA